MPKRLAILQLQNWLLKLCDCLLSELLLLSERSRVQSLHFPFSMVNFWVGHPTSHAAFYSYVSKRGFQRGLAQNTGGHTCRKGGAAANGGKCGDFLGTIFFSKRNVRSSLIRPIIYSETAFRGQTASDHSSWGTNSVFEVYTASSAT